MGTGWGREEGGKDGEGKEEKEEERDKADKPEMKDERSCDRSASTLPLWIMEGVGGARR